MFPLFNPMTVALSSRTVGCAETPKVTTWKESIRRREWKSRMAMGELKEMAGVEV